MINILNNKIDKNVNIKFNNELDGQFRKDGSNEFLLNMIGEFEFTPFSAGVEKTYKWYEKNGGTNEH